MYEHGHEITKLKKQMEPMRMLYKVEDQENRNRRNNLGIRGIPKVESAMNKMFNPLLDRPMEELLEIEYMGSENLKVYQQKPQEM